MPFQNQANHIAKKSMHMFTSRIGWHENENSFLSYRRFNHIVIHLTWSIILQTVFAIALFQSEEQHQCYFNFILTSQEVDNYLEFQRTLWQTNLKNVIHLESCFFLARTDWHSLPLSWPYVSYTNFRIDANFTAKVNQSMWKKSMKT